MKSLMTLMAFMCAGSAFALNIGFAEYYMTDFWPGEYPTGYKIMTDLEVVAVASPDNPAPRGLCTLKKNTVIHPWAKKTKTEFASLQGVQRFVAKKDIELWKTMEDFIVVKAGTEIVQLAYLSEGICLMSANGELAEDGCLSEDDERATLVRTSPLIFEAYFKTACKEGYSAWVNEKELSQLVEEDSEEVQYAEITEYGEVSEP